MSKKITGVLNLVLAVLLVVTTVSMGTAAVAKEKTKTSPQGKMAPIDVSMYLMDFAPSPDKFVITQAIKDKFNINMKWEINPYDGFFDKLNVMVASNELPDLIAPIPIDQAKDIGAKGALVPLNKYLGKMPHLRDLYKKEKIIYTSSMASDGNIYACPAVDQKTNFRYVPTIRKDLLDETGLKAPQTFEELYRVLKAIKAKHPDNIGIVNKEKTDMLNDFGTNFNTRTEMFWDETQDKFIYGPLNDGYKEMLTWFNKLWNEKLMDPEAFTAAEQQFEEKVMSGKAAFWLSWPEFAYKYERNYHQLHPDSKFDSVPIMPMASNYFPKKVVQGMEKVNNWTTIAIAANSKHTERLIPFIDWMYSDEGSILLQYGIKGKTYTLENGLKKYTPDIKASYNPNGTIEQNVLGIGAEGNLLIRVIRHNDRYQPWDQYQKQVEDVLEQYRKNNFYKLSNNGMSLTFTEQQLDERSKYETDLKTYITEESIKFIIGKRPLSEFDAFKAELKKRGASRLETIYAAAYAKFKENLSKIK